MTWGHWPLGMNDWVTHPNDTRYISVKGAVPKISVYQDKAAYYSIHRTSEVVSIIHNPGSVGTSSCMPGISVKKNY